MIERVIKNELKKNLVKDNYSNKFDKLTFRFHRGNSSVKINTNVNGSYGYIFVSIESTTGFNMQINGVTIYNALSKDSRLIPIKFMFNDELCLSGECDGLIISIYGAEFDSVYKDKVLLYENKYVENCGGTKRVYLFDDLSNMKDSFTLSFEENFIDLFEFQYDGSVYYAKLLKDDSGDVYLCTSVDNYVTQIALDFIFDDIIVVPNTGDNLLNLIYLYGGKVYSRELTCDMMLTDEVLLDEVVDIATKLTIVSSDSLKSLFVVHLANGNSVLYIYSINNYYRFFSTKSRKSEFCIIDDNFYHIYKENYDVVIKRYDIDYTLKKLNLNLSKKITYSDNIKIAGGQCLIDYNLLQRVVSVGDL